MTPTPDQTRAGWTTLPDRETWDAHIARGGVWQRMDADYADYFRARPLRSNWEHAVRIDAEFGAALHRSVDPHTGNYWPLPGAVPTEPGLWERRDRRCPVLVSASGKGLVWEDEFGEEYPVTPDGQWIGPYVKTRG